LAPASAAETETRDYNILIDNKPAGSYHMEMQFHEDGSVVMTGRADARATILKVFNYTYTYSGKEIWKHHRLVSLVSTANDNGKPLEVHAQAEGDHFRIRTKRQEQIAPADLWPTSYWRLPDSQLRNGTINLLDADTGRVLSGTMSFIQNVQLNIGGRAMRCSHYRITGPSLGVDLWFDGKDRLVRETYVEEGHRTHLELTKVQP
jgi:hypothetical protein